MRSIAHCKLLVLASRSCIQSQWCAASGSLLNCYSLSSLHAQCYSDGKTTATGHNWLDISQQRRSFLVDSSQHSPGNSSDPGGAANSSSSNSSSGQQAEQLSQQGPASNVGGENAYRRGFGAKVALPARDVLQEVLVGHPATLKLRAYHLGQRIHIGRVQQRAAAEGCRTNSGKDYCIIWIRPEMLIASRKIAHGELQHPSGIRANIPRPRRARALSSQQDVKESVPEALSPSLGLTPASAQDRLHGFKNRLQGFEDRLQGIITGQHRNKDELQGFVERSQGIIDRLQVNKDRLQGSSKSVLVYQEPQQGEGLRGQFGSWTYYTGAPAAAPMLVVYRYGSVVFTGTPGDQEPGLIDLLVPAQLRYKAGGQSDAWVMQGPAMSGSWLPQEEQTVVVKPEATQPAVKGVDKIELRVLDVGSVRVLTSVLGQSVALKFYETSVGDAVDKLSQWRARIRRAAGYKRSGGLGLFGTSQEQTTMFKVFAASALIANEARELLEMAEPAWQYDAYHSIWSLAAEDFELEKRFRALETKLQQVEKEAKHDVKQREGRKYHRLEQFVILLLLVSCMIAFLELSSELLSNSTSVDPDSPAVDAAAAGVSMDEGTVGDAAVDAVQQLQQQGEEAAGAAGESGVGGNVGSERYGVPGETTVATDDSSRSADDADWVADNSSSSSSKTARNRWWPWSSGSNGGPDSFDAPRGTRYTAVDGAVAAADGTAWSGGSSSSSDDVGTADISALQSSSSSGSKTARSRWWTWSNDNSHESFGGQMGTRSTAGDSTGSTADGTNWIGDSSGSSSSSSSSSNNSSSEAGAVDASAPQSSSSNTSSETARSKPSAAAHRGHLMLTVAILRKVLLDKWS